VRHERGEGLWIDEGVRLSGFARAWRSITSAMSGWLGSTMSAFMVRACGRWRRNRTRSGIGAVATRMLPATVMLQRKSTFNCRPRSWTVVLQLVQPGMAGRQLGGERHVAKLHRFPVANHAIDLDRAKGLGL